MMEEQEWFPVLFCFFSLSLSLTLNVFPVSFSCLFDPGDLSSQPVAAGLHTSQSKLDAANTGQVRVATHQRGLIDPIDFVFPAVVMTALNG